VTAFTCRRQDQTLTCTFLGLCDNGNIPFRDISTRIRRKDGNMVHALISRDTARRLNFLRFAPYRLYQTGGRFEIAKATRQSRQLKTPTPSKLNPRTNSSQLLILAPVSMVAHRGIWSDASSISLGGYLGSGSNILLLTGITSRTVFKGQYIPATYQISLSLPCVDPFSSMYALLRMRCDHVSSDDLHAHVAGMRADLANCFCIVFNGCTS
jgi:hypothetical protein